ncbi:hypothetical protein B0G62_10468 [Paraburkholderia eburnea]|uniref:SMODS and SLOG-associating 2TM effector domain-containing protein n=1 Tax=Paraburkholderia eburnea TaxID=1189126 RepID=A0A2S4MDN9_9BURK|nr:hypothetical protein [Paraburkholderia eburnea]POR52771.1 hypothetical protein B0G62_10468 [Paraburkholderia eburnea]PRZ23639.1 hypothetical protein BX588_10468 [Paraburkholderia eburnea]
MTTRSETEFQIGYSIRLEKMQAMLLARADRIVNFLQIVLSAAVIANTAPVLTGVVLAILSTYSFVWQPGGKSMLALAQKQKYENLQSQAASLDDGELHKRYCDLAESDSQAIGSLTRPAHMGEMIRLGIPPDFQLTRLERVFAFLAGDLPRHE